MKNTLVILLTIFSTLSANAAHITLTKLTSQSKPGKVGFLGVNTDEKNEIVSLFYTPSMDGGKDRTMTFSMPDLGRNEKVLYSEGGYDIVRLEALKYGRNYVVLDLNCQHNVFSPSDRHSYFNVAFNPSLGKYEILDSNHRPFAHVHVTTYHNSFGLPVGVDAIQTLVE